MDFEFSEEQKMFREAVQGFVSTGIAPLVKEAENNEDSKTKISSASYQRTEDRCFWID